MCCVSTWKNYEGSAVFAAAALRVQIFLSRSRFLVQIQMVRRNQYHFI